MIKEIVKDVNILTQKSNKMDLKTQRSVITDLLDTLKANKDKGAGLAAIQIGCPVNCFVIQYPEDKFQVYINPCLVNKSSKTYTTMEGCLSLDGQREVKRHASVDIIFTNINGKLEREHTSGLKAEIIQHEYDHLFGRLI